MRGLGREGRLTVDGRPTRAKSRRKMVKARYFSESNAAKVCGKTRRLRAAIWNRDWRGIESPAGDIESISRDFDAAREANAR